MLVEKYAVDVESVVRPFCAINDGAAFNGNTSVIGFYFGICLYYSGDHVEMYLYHISLFPFAGNAEIAIIDIAFYCLSVYGYLVGRFLIVGVRIQVTGKYIATYPAGDTEFHGEVLIALRYFQADVPIPGIAGFLFQQNLFLVYL